MTFYERLLSTIGLEKKDGGKEALGSLGKSEEEFKIEDSERQRAELRDLEWFATHDPITFKGLNTKAASIWGKGCYVEADDKKAKELAESIINIQDYRSYTVTEIIHAFTYGYGVLENIWDDKFKTDKDGNFIIDPDTNMRVVEEEGKNIIGFAITDPKTFDPKWNELNEIQHWTQKAGKTEEKTKKFPLRKITHYKFSQVADEIKGIGLVEPLVPVIESLMSARKSTRKLLFRHGVPFTHLIKQGASPKDIPKLKKVAKGISIATSFASSEKYKFIFHGITGKSVDVKPHIDLLADTMAGGLGMPRPYLFQSGEGVTKATLEKLAYWNEEEIKTYQDMISNTVETQQFKPLMVANEITEIPQLKWKPVTEEAKTAVIANQQNTVKMLNEAVNGKLISQEEAEKIAKKTLQIEVD